ncbi:ATP synthase subunit I [Rhizorhapis sp. SPR117]|uniref:ATP synthase subunit I n=1 Tax=Rhizorhapis sp. SPR117 TaxID=2912611 RepID=UPI001F2D25B5|nr:ATP synthase subunit I [Rhizorhapis sp. SPR117]
MHELLVMASPLLAGLLLGTLFFGGLWWTVNRAILSQHPGLWFSGSMLLRTSITMAGFYFVGREDWARWLLCLLGFVLARLVVKALSGLSRRAPTGSVAEIRYAP